MTTNQINWVNAMENRRSNLANERLKGESNAITYAHNLADEGIRGEANRIKSYEADITKGHYERQDAETARSNLVNEDIKQEANRISKITAKANKRNAESNAKNAETNAYNAQINAYNARVNKQNADTNARNAETNFLNYTENVRSHKANEDITRTHNTNTEKIQAFQAQNQADYWDKSIEQTSYKNTADAIYQQGQLSNANKKTESEINLNSARIKESESKANANKAKANESNSKTVLNYVSAVDKGIDAFTSATDFITSKLGLNNNEGQMFFGFGGN